MFLLMRKRSWQILAAAFLLFLSIFGTGRLWFYFTDGFRIAHITSDLAYDPRWETRKLTPIEEYEREKALSQSYFYLGKGCQSYAFVSEDGKYVLKFIKYKRCRPPSNFFNWFAFIPEFKEYLDHRIAVKKEKQDKWFSSWMVGFDHLPNETGLIYVHLNKTGHLKKSVRIYDPLERAHQLDMDAMEFLIQKKGEMLCSAIDRMMAEGKENEVREMLHGLFSLLVSEYKRGFADTDYAIMQNTGVIDGKVFQLDVGSLVANPALKNPNLYHQELFNKYVSFRLWIENTHPSLLQHIDQELKEEMGESFWRELQNSPN